ncbi:MAG: methyltransferase domain-containing protein [Rhodomicrobiaceae bacterium]
MQASQSKPYRGIGMEGFIANWYAKNTAGDIEDFRRTARVIADRLPAGAQILEIAPGPGFLAIELAKLGAYQITGLDVSKSFVRIATENARMAGLNIDFRLGDAHALPFAPGSFDFIVCRAAFKNFSDPVKALGEMQRVLKPDGTALIIDMRSDVSDATIDEFVKSRAGGRINALLTGLTFKHMLRKRAYRPADMLAMARKAGFSRCDIDEASIGMDVWLRP